MSFDYWAGAERFYEFWFVILSMAIVISVIVIIFIITYARKEKRMKFLLVPISLVIFLGGTGWIAHGHYRPYLEQASYINPLMRDREPRMFGYVAYGGREQSHYSRLNDLDALRNMVLYEEERVTEPVEYLGEGEHFHYFKRSDGQIVKHSRQIEFSESAPQAQIIGSRFTLKNTQFHEIGFKNPENTMFDLIEIPASEQGKTYEPEDDLRIPQLHNRMLRWNF